jgi:hypothetical protein
MSFKNHPEYEMYMLRETHEKKIEELKQEIREYKNKYEDLIEKIIDFKFRTRRTQMTPEQLDIAEMFRMEL